MDKIKAKIANEVLNVLKTGWAVPNDKVTIKVENGWVTLEGELTRNYQREAAKSAVIYLSGIKGVTNNIKIKSKMFDKIEQKDVENAIDRSWIVADNDINVQVAGTKVTLSGTVSSWYQKDKAGRIVWNTPGIMHLQNDLTVVYYRKG